MTAPLKPGQENWRYWEEPDFPKCEHDWGGVNSDPDHCIDCCERTINYLLGKLAHAQKVVEAMTDALYSALPFVEDMQGSEYFKKGFPEAMVGRIRAAIKSGELFIEHEHSRILNKPADEPAPPCWLCGKAERDHYYDVRMCRDDGGSQMYKPAPRPEKREDYECLACGSGPGIVCRPDCLRAQAEKPKEKK